MNHADQKYSDDIDSLILQFSRLSLNDIKQDLESPKAFWKILDESTWKPLKFIKIRQHIKQSFINHAPTALNCTFGSNKPLWNDAHLKLLFYLYDYHCFNHGLDLLLQQFSCVVCFGFGSLRLERCFEHINYSYENYEYSVLRRGNKPIVFTDVDNIYALLIDIKKIVPIDQKQLPKENQLVGGQPAADQFDVLQLVFEHELVHFIENVCFQQVNFNDHHSDQFIKMLNKLFQQTIDLPTEAKTIIQTETEQIDALKKNLAVGQLVTFYHPVSTECPKDQRQYDVKQGEIGALYNKKLKIWLLPEKTEWWQGPYYHLIPNLFQAKQKEKHIHQTQMSLLRIRPKIKDNNK
jgi:hypothetical protein